LKWLNFFNRKKIKVVALITKQHSAKSTSKRTDGKKLSDFADIVLDTGAPVGDSMIYIEWIGYTRDLPVHLSEELL
jgi:uncharacterized phosphosugar-binding protein